MLKRSRRIRAFLLTIVSVMAVPRMSQGQHDPLFLPAVLYDTDGGKPSSVVLEDVNGDGKLDAIVANRCTLESYGCAISSNDVNSKIGIMLGNGDGTFQPVAAYDSGGCNEIRMAVGDLNGDHHPDLVVANNGCTSFRFSVMLGNGDGTFQPARGASGDGGFELWAVELVDVNNDDVLDVLTADACSAGCEAGEPSRSAIGVSLGRGDGTFRAVVNYAYPGSGPFSLKAADVNGDGTLDLLATICRTTNSDPCSDSNGEILVRLGKGDGTFKAAQTYELAGKVGYSIAVADLNRDGKQDVVVGNGSIDYVAGSGSGIVGVLLGNGDGTFQAAVNFASGGDISQFATVDDINQDGAPDIVIANYLPPGAPVGLLLGQGDGSFAPVVSYYLPNPVEKSESVALGDLNGDGLLDIVIAATSVTSAGKMGVMLNNTGPHHVSSTSLLSDLNPVQPNQLVTYSAGVSSESGEVISGTFIFRDGGTKVAEVPLLAGSAKYTTGYKWGEPVRAHTISASYSGDLYHAGSTSSTLTEYVGVFPVGSKMALSSDGSPAFVGQPITFIARVQATESKYGSIPDGGRVSFFDGTVALGSVVLTNQQASLTTSSLASKTHTIRATYEGSTLFKTSTTTAFQVVQKYATSTARWSNVNPAKQGQPVTFTARVTGSGSSQPSGAVVFMDGATRIGSAVLSTGTARLTKSTLAIGTHVITAHYSGDAMYSASASIPLTQIVE